MPKIIELTVEIDIQKVSCPGVWLCQGGRVCLTVFALGTSYQTCLLPPVFPLMFKDVFYFKKRFQQSCALNNICCLLKDETIYCELIQCSTKCKTNECLILAQYLGAMNDVLFPPNMCSSDGVDLLMRRSNLFPGILSPKIEIATKVRIDEVWSGPCPIDSSVKIKECPCRLRDEVSRQKQVCHSARYHRSKCKPRKYPGSRSSSMSRSRSAVSSSLHSINQRDEHCSCTKPAHQPPFRPPRSPSRTPLCRNYCGFSIQNSDFQRNFRRGKDKYGELSDEELISSQPRVRSKRERGLSQVRDYYVYNVHTPSSVRARSPFRSEYEGYSDGRSRATEELFDTVECTHGSNPNYEDDITKVTIQSRYIDQETSDKKTQKHIPRLFCRAKASPCVCEICQRYHELFHSK